MKHFKLIRRAIMRAATGKIEAEGIVSFND